MDWRDAFTVFGAIIGGIGGVAVYGAAGLWLLRVVARYLAVGDSGGPHDVIGYAIVGGVMGSLFVVLGSIRAGAWVSERLINRLCGPRPN
jgi:hypothetical protein